MVFDAGAVLGDFTYLASEVVFGSVALVLLARAAALRRAARTIAVLYPVAFVWDWYTLSIGVFEIRLRTGVDLLGIPIEEHLFMLVVPGLVIGVHETLRARDDRGGRGDPDDRAGRRRRTDHGDRDVRNEAGGGTAPEEERDTGGGPPSAGPSQSER